MPEVLNQLIPKLMVFLCHSSEDKPKVRNLYKRLVSDGFNPWLDEENLLPGQPWDETILKAVRESDVVIVCTSCTSVNKTGFVQKEIKFALDVADMQPEGKIFIIPARLEECNVPARLSYWQWVDLYSDQGYTKLLGSLNDCAQKKYEKETKRDLQPQKLDKSSEFSNARPSLMAGQWYSANPKNLIKTIDSAFTNVTFDIPEQSVVGLFMPNAGSLYCWDVAAQSMRQICGIKDRHSSNCY